MTSVLLAAAIVLGFSAFLLHRRHRSFTVFYEVVLSNVTVRFTQMQINANLGSSHVFSVVVIGSQGEKMHAPIDFVLDNPAVASFTFDQAAMTLTIAATGLGTATLTETAANGVSKTHQIEVTDTIVSVDLEPVETVPVAS